MHPRIRLLISLLIGLAYGSMSGWYNVAFDRSAGDFSWPHCAARALLAGEAPYAACIGQAA